MAITRRYLCDDCEWEWTVLHFSRDEPIPDCPRCEAADEVKAIPGSFSIKTNASRAGDTAYRMAEETYGITDANDNLREGDTFAKAPRPVQTAEAEAMVEEIRSLAPTLSPQQAEQAKNFWMRGMAPDTAAQAQQQVMAQAAPAAQVARLDSSDPMKMLHEGEKATGGRMNLEVVGRSKMTDG